MRANGDVASTVEQAGKRCVGITTPGYKNHDIESGVLRKCGAEIRILDWQGDRSRLCQMLRDIDVLMVRDLPFLDAEVIGHMREGSGIVRYGVGVDNIDLEAAKKRSIKVANVPDYGADIEVSDHAAALTLALTRRIVSRDKQVRCGLWNIAQKEPMYRISEMTLGLVGFGKIARAYLSRMRGFGVSEILVFDPYIDDETIALSGAKRASFEDICKTACVISLHAPVTTETRNIVNADSLALMSERACIINTSRGALIDTAALAEALKNNRIFGAALDVLDREPMATDCPLRDLDNVILTDHTAWYSEASVQSLQNRAAYAAVELLTAKIPTNWVNKWQENFIPIYS